MFIVMVLLSLGLSWMTFSKMFKVISRGSDPLDWKKAFAHFPKGLGIFLSQRTLFKTRPVVGGIHAAVAWGFTLYMAVNVVDILYGMIPGFHFIPNHFIGKVYRLFVDIFSVLVIVGVKYFIFIS